MSERMTNSEIEDVLTSIRRLVSEETRFPFRSERRKPSAEPADKLMLTPDFRVVEAEAPKPEPDAATAADAAAESPAGDLDESMADAPPALGGRIAVLEAAISDRLDDWEPDGSEVKPSVYLSQPLPEPDAGAEVAAEFDAAAEPQPEEIASHIALAETPEIAEPDPDAEVSEAGAGVAHAIPEAGAPEGTAAQANKSGKTTEDLVWDDEEEQAIPHFAHRAEPEEGLFDPPETDELDEEALREIIREIIREELQGSLGERITRNVRKLVRAEVNRALAGREFG